MIGQVIVLSAATLSSNNKHQIPANISPFTKNLKPKNETYCITYLQPITIYFFCPKNLFLTTLLLSVTTYLQYRGCQKKLKDIKLLFSPKVKVPLQVIIKKVLLLKPDKNLSLLEYTTLTATFQVVLNKLVWKWLSLNNKS